MSTPANALVEKIRGKFPGAYDDISDSDLTQKILAKHPEYGDLAETPATSDLTRQTNAAASAGGAISPGISPTPLPDAGKKVFGKKYLSPLDPSMANAPQMAAPVAPFESAFMSAPKFIGGLAGNYGASKLAEHYGAPELASDAAGIIGGGAGTGWASMAEDAFNPASIARAVRTPEGALKPGVSNSARVVGGIVGSPLGTAGTIVGGMAGPSIADAMFPRLPENPAADLFNKTKMLTEAQESALSENSKFDRAALVKKDRLQRIADKAKDARDQALTERGQSMQMQQAYQDKLDAAKVKADNALARSQRDAQARQGEDMTAEIEYNQNLSRQATQAAEENRQRNLQAAQAEEQRVQGLHDQFAKSLKDLESHRQKTLADRGKLNNQWGESLNRRGNEASGAISPNSPEELQGNPTPFSPSMGGQDIISRTRRLTIPDQELGAGDIKKANDATNIKTDKLKQLARFGDMAAKNELNRRMKQ